jgi:hypothetical protein
MGTGALSRSRFSNLVYYSMLVWTILCFVGTWVIILKYGILLKGLAALAMTFFFAAALWMIPLSGLILLSLYITPRDESPPAVMFKELIRKGMSSNSG